MKKKPSIIKDILFISISSFVVVAAWIGFNIYHSWVTTTITPELQIQITPIHPDFDMATIEQLKTRRQIAPISNLSSKTPSDQQVTTTPTPSETPEENIPIATDGE